MPDTRWLQQRARGWYAVREVPRPLRSVIGKTRLVASLHTRDLVVARARRHAALVQFERVFADARKQRSVSEVVEAGMAWRDTYASIERGDEAAIRALAGDYVDTVVDARSGREIEWTPKQTARDTADLLLTEQAEAIGETRGDAAAAEFVAIAIGKATPLLHYVDDWLAEGGSRGPVTERTKHQYRVNLAELEEWLSAAGVPPTIEAVTKRVAARYVTEGMVGAGVHNRTANRKISAASAYWRWLVKRAVVAETPWVGQSLPTRVRTENGERAKRPFTTAEIVTLLNGPADPELADAMRIAALSGMRIEEVYRLTVADCTDGWFVVRQAKTQAGIRRVPIHSELAEIVTRRCVGRDGRAFLFPEPGGPPKPGRERSMPASKRFGHYRKRLGVHDREDGRRQSRVDFHSWRRWFVTEARRAGFDRAIVAAVVGHQTGNITDDVYSGGPSDAQKVACVEAVKLPVG